MKKEVQHETINKEVIVNYKDLDKDTLVKLGKKFDIENGNQLFDYLQTHKLSFGVKKPVPFIKLLTGNGGAIIDYDFYHKAFEFSAKYQLLRNTNVKNFVKENPGNTLFKIKIPDSIHNDIHNSGDFFTINGAYRAFELGYCLLLESGQEEIAICNKYEKEVFRLSLNENGVFTGTVVVNKDDANDSLDKILDDLCGCADHISLEFSDDNTAEKLDMIGTRISKLLKAALMKEDK